MTAELRRLLAEATPGPWRWHGQIGPNHEIGLRTVGNGVLYIMGAKRLGMQGAEFTFWRRKPDEHWGWNGDMETASEVAVREVPYRKDIVDIANPNAQLIVAAVNALPALLDVVEAARFDHLSRHGGSQELAASCTGPSCARIRAALDRLDRPS
jgi:hypothetical protein